MRKILDNISRITCRPCTGRNESWCSFAFAHKERNRAAWLFVQLIDLVYFDPGHCKRSFEYYHGVEFHHDFH